MSKSIKPLGQLILVKPIEATAQELGGILIPASAQTGLKKSVIVALGTKNMPAELVVGSTVLTQYAGFEVKIEGVKHCLLNLEDILGVVEE